MQDELYIAFRQSWELMHQASIPNKDQFLPKQSQYPKWIPPIVFAMFLCAALLSGVHTIPTVYDAIIVGAIITEGVRQVASVLSFVAVELSVFIAAYMLTKDKGMAWGVLIVGFSVAMIANLTSVAKALNAVEAGGIIVSVVLGFGMPLIALMAGKMFVNINQAERYAIAKAEYDYQQAREAFDAAVLSAYNEYVKSTGRKRTRITVSNDMSNSVQNGQIGQVAGQVSSVQSLPSKVPNGQRVDARTRVMQHLDAYPMDISIPVRELADKIGVSKSTVSDVIKTIRSTGQDNES